MKLSRDRSHYVRILFKVVRYVAIAILLLFFLFPIIRIGFTSFMNLVESTSYPPVWIPKNLTLDNYRAAFSSSGEFTQKFQTGGARGHALKYIANSVLIALVTAVVSVSLGALAAYSLARWRTGGKNLSFFIISTRMAPPIATIIPLYILLREFRLINTHFAVIIAHVLLTLPFVTWLLKGFFADIPLSLEESAMVDGCSRMQAFWRITLPLMKPALVTAALFCVIFSWNDFLYPLILTSTPAVQTVPILIAGFRGTRGILFGQISAVSLVSISPPLLVVLFFQRYLIRGLAMGAIKE